MGCCCGNSSDDTLAPVKACGCGYTYVDATQSYCPRCGIERRRLAAEERGPNFKRSCTDWYCTCVALFSLVCHLWLFWYLHGPGGVSSVLILAHGHDHYRNLCGTGNFTEKRYTYYPDLATDFRNSRYGYHYGVCLDRCPQQGSTIEDYEQDPHAHVHGPGVKMRRQFWFVTHPTFNLMGRCIPYEPDPFYRGGVEMCAHPACSKETSNEAEPADMFQVCGLRRDGTDTFWLLSEADAILKEGWKAEGVESDDIISARVEMAKKTKGEGQEARKKCEVFVTRDTRIKMEPQKDTYLVDFLSHYTSIGFRCGQGIYENWAAVLILGIAGSLVLSWTVVSLFTCCARIMVILLILLFFLVMCCADYIMFYYAGLVSGGLGQKVIETIANQTLVEGLEIPLGIEKLLQHQSNSSQVSSIWKWGGVLLLVFIFLCVCGVFALWKNLEVLIGLLHEASRTIRSVPSLVMFPVIMVASMLVTCAFAMFILMGIATTDAVAAEPWIHLYLDYVAPIFKVSGYNVKDPYGAAQETIGILVVVVFLWAYFTHVAVFVCIVALTVTHWYFYRKDSDNNMGLNCCRYGWYPCKPVTISFFKVFRFHFGSLAVGALINTIATIPRLLLEYVTRQTKISEQHNQLTRALGWTTRCCLCCLQRCLQFMTEYAFVYVAVTGKPFCSSARQSFRLFANYPVQVAMDKMASSALGYLTCVTVPGFLIVLSWLVIQENWGPPAAFIAGLAYVTTRLTVGVYDVCITTLFVCVMRDLELYNGKHMPESLRNACHVNCSSVDQKRIPAGSGIELTSMEGKAPESTDNQAQEKLPGNGLEVHAEGGDVSSSMMKW